MPSPDSSTPVDKDGATISTISNNMVAIGISSTKIQEVTIHPLVLLSAADHYHRVARGTRKRVVGVLLGQVLRGVVDATNSFAVPFEEDSRNPAVFYLDHNYLENMLSMFRKVNAKERVVGFYSTGPQIRSNDLRIFDIVQRFLPEGCQTPAVFCIIDIRPDRTDLPVTAYQVVEEVSSSGSSTNAGGGGGAGMASPKKPQANSQTQQQQQQAQKLQRSFTHVPARMGALEAEEVGVEHLLRDINDPTISTVASLIRSQMAGLQTLAEKLKECQTYLEACARGEITKVNPVIIANLQTVLNLLPNLNTEDMVRSLIVKTNDMHMAIYLASLIRTVIALHDLVNNKIRFGEDGTEYKQLNQQQQTTPEEEKKEEEVKKGEKGTK